MLWTLGASTVVIWRRWTSDTRPSGWSMKMSTPARPATASIAAEPVSPLVAPTIGQVLVGAGQEALEQQPEQLQRDVLERERRAVEQFEQPVIAGRAGRAASPRRGEAAIGLRRTAPAVRRASARRRRTAPSPRPRCRHRTGPRSAGDLVAGQRRPGFGQVQPAVAGEPGERRRRGNRGSGAVAAGADVAHGARG